MTSAFIYVMAITMTYGPLESYEYVGHFQTCKQALAYVDVHHPDMKGSRCMFEEYTNLPADTIKKEITMEGRS